MFGSLNVAVANKQCAQRNFMLKIKKPYRKPTE